MNTRYEAGMFSIFSRDSVSHLIVEKQTRQTLLETLKKSALL